MRKFRDIASIVAICLLAVVLLASSAQARPASVLLQEGLYAEEIEGDLDAAIRIYEQIAADKSAGSRYAAQAMYRLGLCYQKKQDYQQAKATFEKLIARFPKEKSIIEKVQPLLDQMSTQDPAALMPAETLVYLEIGSPGKQIETILNMLKGTPFENPLAVISAAGGPSPKDMMAALLNPSMITEFKKIRGIAIGFQAIHSDNPPLVAVIYPGESDALRGIIIAGLGMMFQAGEPIAGMQTLRMADIGGAAYDDNVIILASPIDRLTWCVKQYKGITNEPTLASQNKAFQKLSRRQREQNAYTIWADVDRIFPMLKEEMPDEQRRLIESIGDIGNVDEFTASLSLEKDGIAVETNIGFKDGHNCLAYNLIRTPNISKVGFEAVPPEAVAVVSFALSEFEGGGVAGARKALRKLTGLDIGRELFANIEQVTLFALPPTPTSNKHILAKNISPIVPCLGLAVTSHNSKRTHQLFTQLLTIANLAMNLSMGEESGQPTIPTPGKYRIGTFDDKPAYCYMGQAGKSTILSLTPEVLQTSLSSVKSGKSALSTGPLHEILSQLPSDASKLVAVNAGGAVRLADVHLCKSLGVSPDPDKNYFSQLLGQLAQACDETYVVVRTDEKTNNFGLNVNISGLPDFGQIFPLLAQIPGAMENPMLAATRPSPADKAVLKPTEELELRWRSGMGATAHKVYFGTNTDKLSVLAEVKTPGYPKLPRVQKGITYYWRVDEVQADGSVVTGDIWSFSTGKLVAWWKFDEKSGNTAEDSSGNNYHGTAVHGDPIWKPDGKFGGCLDFNERYGISIPKGVFSGIDKAITISVWVYGNQRQKKHSDVILQAGARDAGKPYIVSIYTDWLDYGLKFATGIGEPDRLEFNPGAPEDWTGRWNHYAFVKDADKGFKRIYMNGSLVAEKTGAMASMSGVGAARIGIAPDRFGDQHIGRLDDFRIYNYALSSEEIQQLCGIVPGPGPAVEPVEPGPPAPPAPSYLKGLVGHWKFDEGKGSRARDSVGNYDGTLKGPKWTTGPVGSALEFSGKDAVYLQGSVGRESLLNIYDRDLTISSWVKIRGGGGTIVARATRSITAYRLAVTASTALIDVIRSQHWVLQTDEILQQDTWYHIVGVFDRSRKSGFLYVNGIRKARGQFSLRSASINESTKIGCRYPRGETFNGAIDEVMIFNRALSDEEIKELYTKVSGFRPASEVLLFDWDHPTAAYLIDLDTRKRLKIPDPLRLGGSDEAFRWMERKGLDVGAKFTGDEYGLIGVDVVATRIASEQWDKITPTKLGQILAAEPAGVEKQERQTIMPAKGEYPPTFAFRTREGAAGVLQIYDADRSKKTIRFRHKMLQEPLEVKPAPPTVGGFGPVIDRMIPEDISGLDFDTGKMFAVPQMLKNASPETGIEWAVNNGVDVGFDQELIALDMAVESVPAKVWQEISVTKLMAITSEATTVKGQQKISHSGQQPPTYAFRTREGGMGILQILDVTDKGLKVRYKMLQPGAEEPVLKLQVVEPKREWWRIEPTVTKSIHEGDDLEIEWDVGKTRKKIKAFAVGVLPIKEDISDLRAHYYREDDLAFTVRRTPYGKKWKVRERSSRVSRPKTLRPGEYRVYVCAFSRYRHGVSWSDRLSDVIGAGTAKLIVKPRPQTHTFAPGFGPAKPLPVDELIKSGRVPAFRTVLHGNSALDLETGAVVSLPVVEQTRVEVSARPGAMIGAAVAVKTQAQWPEGFDVAWSYQGGEALVVRPDSAVRIVAIPGAEKERWDQAISLARGALAILRTSTADKIFASQTSFAAVLTSEGNLATISIGDYRQQKASLSWWIERPMAKRPVPTGYCKIFLPEAESAVNDLLDLASGTLRNSDAMRRDVAYFERLGQGDIAFDEINGQDWLFCFRGARMQRRLGDGLTSSEPDRVEGAGFIYLYQVREVPSDFVVTTAEGHKYELKVLSRERGDRLGVNIEYWKSAGAPAEFTGAVAVLHPDSAVKLSRLGKAVAVYAADNNGKLPGTLQELKPYVGGDFQWLIENVKYFGKGQESEEPDTPIAYDKTLLEKGNGTNILFLDGHVEFRQPEELTSVKHTIEHR